jgi:hypothetical protein
VPNWSFLSRFTRRQSLILASGLAVLGSIWACADSFRTVWPSPAVAERRADELFGAFAARFTQVERNPKYNAARMRLAQAALVPSRVFGDTSVWSTQPSSNQRLLLIQGELRNARYQLEARPSLAAIVRPSDSHHSVLLERVGDHAFRWETQVEFGLGSLTADDAGAIVSNLLRAAEGRAGRDLRVDYRGAFPRAAGAFGRGFSIDSLQALPSAAGTTNVTLVVAFRPDAMRASFPLLAGYLDKYLRPAKYHFTLTDRSSAVMFDMVGADRRLTIKYRLQHGKLVSLSGAPRPLPDTLQLHADASLKVKMFTVGFHNLVTDFAINRSARERSWTVVAQREPEWDLPLATEHLIRSPLRRPFEGPGAMFRVGVRDSVGGQSLLVRQARLAVQESAIMRFIGSLATHATKELADRVEVERDRFLREAFAALQEDVGALAVRWADTENATRR